jgi:hypothetical protein
MFLGSRYTVAPQLPPNVTKLRRALLERDGHTTHATREQIVARAARHRGGSPADANAPPDDLPGDLARYVDTVAKHAHRVTDEDVLELKHAGYSEDQLFEVTLAAALGAALGTLERGLGALEQAEHERARTRGDP